MVEKILIVDNDPNSVDFLKLVLSRQGYITLDVSNGMDALKLAHEKKPDLIILDIILEGLDGYEVARGLRQHPETALIPILMVTAKTNVEDKLAGYEAGVDTYLTKPVHPVELQANIKALLTQRKARGEALTEKGYVAGILAPQGGLGVSTVTLNLAIQLQKKMNIKVIAAELRPGQGTWAQDLDIQTPRGLTNLLQLNQSEITSAAVQEQLVPTSYSVLLLLASDHSKDVHYAMALAQYEAIVKRLALLANFIALDIGTNFIPGFDIISDLCDEIILVIEPLTNSVKRGRQLKEELRAKGFSSTKALTVVTVNHCRTEMTLGVSQIENVLGYSVALGFPPSTELAYLSVERSIPISLLQPDGIIAQQFVRLAEQISKHVKK